MGFSIAQPGRFERFVLVGRKERSISTWPSPPDTDEAPAKAWELVGFMSSGDDQVAVYGYLAKEHRQGDDLASRIEQITSAALASHDEKALTKAQVRETLMAILAEIE